LTSGIPYIDITGEPNWLRKLFDEYGPRAAEAGIPMLPAIGYDYVPGNLAGALALEAAGNAAHSVDIGYFLTGENSRSMKSLSGGTLRSLRASSSEEQFAFQGGKLVSERGAKRVIAFKIAGRRATAVSIGSTEHYTLPRLAPQLENVNAGLGWFGPASRAVTLASALGRQAERIPGVSSVVQRITGGQGMRDTNGASGPSGPNENSRAQARTNVVAVARDAGGRDVARVHLDGPNPYDLTGEIVGWVAGQAEDGSIDATGAIGPVEAFGLEALRDACAAIGLKEIQ
ncbi:MAG: saccharopine dehydrogenase, partial [Solirubrobacterales bacterium]